MCHGIETWNESKKTKDDLFNFVEQELCAYTDRKSEIKKKMTRYGKYVQCEESFEHAFLAKAESVKKRRRHTEGERERETEQRHPQK